jgi:2,3-diketo-5-methylthio-1-phosphopentane phosphatase
MTTHIVLDFDGTVTTLDVGDAVCDRFAPADWRDIDAKWHRGEISLPEAQRGMWALVRAAPSEIEAYVGEVARLRPGLDALLDEADRQGWAVTVASGGFDFYIRPVLGPKRLARLAACYSNRAHFENGGVRLEFADGSLACRRCAVCKGKICERLRAPGVRVAFVGDGYSDRCAIGRADRLYAVRGSSLASGCAERGFACVEFEDLDQVRRALLGDDPPPIIEKPPPSAR